MLEYRHDPQGRRLVCPEALGGCDSMTDTDDDGRGNDWTCPKCKREWNIHDAQRDLSQMELEEG